MDENNDIIQKIIYNEPMKKHTSFKIGGNADFFVSVKTIEELKQALFYAKQKQISRTIIGNGTNILVSDSGIRGIVIKIDIQKFDLKEENDYIEISVGSGNKMMALATQLKKQEISGFEQLSGIPGTIGGAIYMNAGAYGKEMKDIVISTRCMNMKGEIFELSNEEQKFEYRSSVFNTKEYIILEAKLKLKKGKKEDIELQMNEYLNQRKEKQP
ncbi:MAG TPA: UDP-N-acetylenolpyruvoylglucosamine reductase, partial [Clostridiales bacterium]|nr:UDP-N-acetylenolpyruvoylglucosamine reductase [Clostridiales bacterium]